MKPTVTLATIITLTFTAMAGAQDDVASMKAQLAKLKAENQQLRRQVTDLQQQLADARNAQAQAEQKAEAIELDRRSAYLATDYDADDNVTTITSRVLAMPVTHGSVAEHWINYEATFAGKTPAQPIDIYSAFIQTHYSGSDYPSVKQVTFIIDGKEYDCDVTDYDKRTRRTGGRQRVDRSDEYLTIAVPHATLEALGAGREVKAKIGHVKLDMSKFSLEAARVMLAATESE